MNGASLGHEPSMTGPSTSSACSGSEAASWMTAAAMRHLGGAALGIADLGDRRPRRGQLTQAYLRLQQARPRAQREWVLVGQQRLHPLAPPRTPSAPPRAGRARDAARPRAWCTISSVPGSPSGSQRALRPLEPPLGLIEPPEPQQGHRSRGQGGDDDRILAPAVRLGDPHRLLAELRAPRRTTVRSTDRRSRGDRDSGISSHGRPARRARSSACSRSRRASSSREDHSSATPRFCSATALSSSLSARSPAGCAASAASTNGIASSTVSEIAAPAREHELQHGRAARQSAACAPPEPCRSSSLGEIQRTRRTASRSPCKSTRGGEHERELRIRRCHVVRKRASSSSHTAPDAAVEGQIDVVVGQQARGQRPVARRLRVADRLDDVPVLLRTTGPPPGEARRCCVGEARRSSSCSRSANRWW